VELVVGKMMKYSEGYQKMGFCWTWDEENVLKNVKLGYYVNS
jgi:hypothetical protein